MAPTEEKAPAAPPNGRSPTRLSGKSPKRAPSFHGGAGDGAGTAETEEERRAKEQEKVEEELERKRAIEQERGVRITTIEDRDFEKVVGSAWRTQRIQRLDFSGFGYDLESLDGLTKLDKNKMNRLAYMDVSNNRLHNIDIIDNKNGFEMLIVLLARRNSIQLVSIHLSHLLELNLAHNMLTVPPDLKVLPNLEVLVLSNNLLAGSFQGFQHGKRLKTLDISFNKYECCPSELANALKYLAEGAKNLGSLRMYANPFVAVFPEYQVFAVKALPNLKKLDDLKITRTLRTCVMDTKLLGLEVYDDSFRKRKNNLEAETMNRNVAGGAQQMKGFAKLSVIVQELESIFDDPTSLQKHVTEVHAHATTYRETVSKAVKRGTARDRESIEDMFWSGMEMENQNWSIVGNRTIELLVGVMERHEAVRFPVIETLGYLTAVSRHDFGAKCMVAIGRTMLGDDLSKNMAADTLRNIVMKNMQDLCMKDVLSAYSKAVVGSLNAMLRNKRLTDTICDAFMELVPVLVTKFNAEPMIVNIPHMVKLLANLTETPENAMEAAIVELCLKCIAAIDTKSIAEGQNRQLYVDILNLSENVMFHCPGRVLDTFVNNSTHVQVVSQCKINYGRTNCQESVEADVCSNMLNFITAMMTRPVVMLECCESFHIIEMLCKMLIAHSIDPLILKSACRCLTKILEDKSMFKKYAPQVVENLQSLVPLLAFTEGQRYSDLYKRAVAHDVKDVKPEDIQVPPITHMTNGKVVDALLAVIGLLALFLKEEDDDGKEHDEHAPRTDPRHLVHEAMDANSVECKLLSLLFTPNDEIKLAVMHCIVDFPLTQIAPMEMGMLIKTIAGTRNIGEGKAEEVLALLIKMLGRLVRDEEKPGKEFREGYAAIAIAEVYQTLCKNAHRDTHGSEDEEQQKLTLSRQCVAFLRYCSAYASLRKPLRSLEVEKHFPELLKLEEEHHGPRVADVAIEQTWVGRSLETLLSCFKGQRALAINRKAYLRALSRIAFVLEGRTEDLNSDPKTLQEILADESTMWPDRTELMRQQCYMDDDERDDRETQVQRFMETDGVRILLDNLHDEDGNGMAEAEAKYTKDGEHASLQFNRIVDALQDIQAADQGDKGKDPDYLTAAMMLDEENFTDCPKPLFVTKHGMFNVPDDPYEKPDDLEHTSLWPAYGVSMFLRVLHALILVPPTNEIRSKVISQLLKRKMMIMLIGIVKDQQCLHCHVAAKFMRLLHLMYSEIVEFGVATGQHALNYQNLKVLAAYITEYAGPATSLLDITADRCLEPAEEVLGMEMARSTGTILRAGELLQASSGGSPKSSTPVNYTFIQKCVEALVDPICIQLFISFILYELQMDMGGGSRMTIKEDFVEKAYKKAGLKEQCSQCLARLLQWANDNLRYDVLEQFSRAEVFLSQNVRPCFLAELLWNTNFGKYMQQVEKSMLKGGRFAFCEMVHALHVKTNTPVSMILCACTEKVYLLSPRDVNSKEPGAWDPVTMLGDNFCTPVVEMERPTSELLGLYGGFGSQLLGLEWRPRGSKEKGLMPRALMDAGKTGDAKESALTLLSFHSSVVRDAAAYFLQRASGPDEAADAGRVLSHRGAAGGAAPAAGAEASRAKMLADGSLRAATLEKAPKNVLAVTVATLAPSATGDLWGASATDSKPYLFVMTTTAVHQFSLHFDAWTIPASAESYFYIEDDFVPASLEVNKGHAQMPQHRDKVHAAPAAARGGKLPPTQAVVLAPEKSSGRFGCTVPGFGKSGGAKVSGLPVLEHKETCAMPLKSIEFDVGLYPDLHLEGDRSIRIRFCDDAARERWRRALAYVCRGWARAEEA